MIRALEQPGATEALCNETIPFVTAAEAGSPYGAAAAMMLQAVDYHPAWLGDTAALAQFTGGSPNQGRFTTGARMLQSFSDHGIGVTVVGQLHLEGFAAYGASALPNALAAQCGELSEADLQRERYSTGLLVGKLAARGAYERRAATIGDVITLRQAGWVVSLDVNGRALQGAPGYRQQPLVVVAAADEQLVVHTPGSEGVPAQAEQILKADELQAAWADGGFMLRALGRVRQAGS